MDLRILDLIEEACEISSKSSMKIKHGAILLRNRRDIVYKSYNNFPHHAEANVLRKSNKTYHVRKCVDTHPNMILVVARRNSLGHFCNSKPCRNCAENMIRANIKYVIYTTGTDEMYRVERPQHIQTSHISSGQLYTWS